MNPYEARRQARADRLRERASKASKAASAHIASSERLASFIPMGQPILVGHHSEKRHRRDLERINRGHQKGFELQQEAKRLETRADRIESSNVISSDDPEAGRKLDEKIAALKAERDTIKAKRRAAKGSVPDYVLPNLSANIRRLESRLQALTTHQPKPEVSIGDIRIVEEDNRVKMFFPDKPSAAIRSTLKQNGFRYSPSNDAWQRHASDYAWQQARMIAEESIK